MEKKHKIILSFLLILFTILVIINTFVYKNVSVAAGSSSKSGTNTNTNTNTNEVDPYPPIDPINEVTTDENGGTTSTQGTIDANGDETITSEVTPGDVANEPDPKLDWVETTPKAPRSGIYLKNVGCSWGSDTTFLFEDLVKHGDILCNKHPSPLRGSGAPEYGTLPKEGYEFTNRSRSNVPTAKLSQSKASGGGRKSATPLEAYILAYATDPGGYEKTPAQLAWWNTHGSGGSSNSLVKAAKDFQSYMNSVGYKGANVKFSSGTKDDSKPQKSLETYWEVTYDPKWITGKEGFTANDLKYIKNIERVENPTVKFDAVDGKSVTIGDFALKYVYHEKYAFITEMEITLNDSSNTVLKKGDFEILVENKEYLDDGGFPLPGRPFQIKINNKKDATKILNIHVEFRYTTGKGSYQTFSTYAQKTSVSATSHKNPDLESPNKYLYNGKLTVNNYYSTQPFVAGINVEITTFIKALDRYSDNEGQVEIQKIVVDEKDPTNTPLDVDKYYEFKLKVGGSEETLRVKANSTVTSKVYTWGLKEPIPTYEIEEKNASPGTFQIDKASGSLISGKTVTVKVINKIKSKTGQLSIEKKVVDEFDKIIDNPINMDDPNPANRSSEIAKFNFNVTIKGKFKYNGGEYKEQSVTFPVTVAGNTTVNALNGVLIEWYEDAPEYFVEEVNIPKGYEKGSITPSSGVLTESGTKVTSINPQSPISSKIRIVKELENSDKMSKEYLESLEYKFKLEVNYNYPNREPETEIITLDKNNIEVAEDGTYRWIAESDVYSWYNKIYPTYTIKETYRSDGQALLGEASGDFKAGELRDGVYVIDQSFRNETLSKTSKIRIIKQIDEDDKDKLEILKLKDYKFVLKIKGTFLYNGRLYKDQTIQLTNTACTEPLENSETFDDKEFITINVSEQNYWDSSDITWYGDTPTYTAEEFLADEDINHTINPDHGLLTDIDPTSGANLVIITARNNYDSKVGYLDIIKELDGSENYSPENLKDLIFKFKIELFKDSAMGQPIEQETISITPELEDTKWVWKYSGKYSWKVSEEAPYFRITEIDVPKDTEFDETVTSTKYPGQTITRTSDNLPVITGQLIENPAEAYKEGNEDKAGIKPTKVNFVNRLKGKSRDLTVEKKVTDDSLNDDKFNFNVTISGTFTYDGKQYYNDSVEIPLSITGSGTAKTNLITWYGNISPSYVVEEEESEVAEIVSMKNEVGSLDNGLDTTIVTFINQPKKKGNTINLTKKIVGASSNIVTDDTFAFDVTIGGITNRVNLKTNETYQSDYIEWYASDEAPKYEVKEVESSGFALQDIQNKTGSLEDSPNIVAVAYNKTQPKKGSFSVVKQVVKTSDFIKLPQGDSNITFNFVAKIEGTFMVNGEMHYAKDPAKEIPLSITFTKGEIESKDDVLKESKSTTVTWWGEDVPTVTVEEINIPYRWKQVGSPSNNCATLSETEKTKIVVSNEFMPIELLLELGGVVWEDEKQDPGGKSTLNSVPNGEIDGSEKGIKGVEVYIYKEDGSLATAYNDNLRSTITYPILTNDKGEWKAYGLELKDSVRYNVQFVYDGQTFEPTTFLATKAKNAEGVETVVEGSTADYIANKANYKTKSMAKDENREEVDNRIGEIYGDTTINGNGETSGKVRSTAGAENSINYKADISNIKDTSKLKSNLITTDENGVALDLFKAKASTRQGGLMYPLNRAVHLSNTDFETYKAAYDYCQHINLGLVRRKTADLEATKDLYSAKVIVDGKEQQYKFNQLGDLGKELYERELDYKLGLYKTDYYYRAEIYKTNSELYNQMNALYKKISGNEKDITNSELEVYLTYKLNIYNSSEDYIVKVNSINDYYDTSFGEPVRIDTKEVVDGSLKDVITADGTITNSGVTNPNGYWQEQEKKELEGGGVDYENNGDAKAIEWNLVETNINSSDGKKYNKMTVDLRSLDLKLGSGKRAEIYVTFKVKKDDIDGVKDSIILGEKSNIVELASYSTFYNDGRNAGKIDLDSAPANLNLGDHNEKTWYEDDTHIAPVLELYLKDEIREIDGIAWEDDKKNESYSFGDGKIGKERSNTKDEARIGGLTTELVEKITIPNDDGSTTTYDFLWPTSERLICLGGRTIEEVTGFSSTIETLRERTPEFLRDAEGNLITDEKNERVTTLQAKGYNVQKQKTDSGVEAFAVIREVGAYNFNDVPMGEFVVRFLYGNDKTELDDQSKVTLNPPQALTENGTPYISGNNDYFDKAGNPLIYTANYDKDELGSTPAVYNGQDFKSTIFENNVDNKAKDSESRRLEVIANSQTITSENSSVLKTANDIDQRHTDLYNQYSMYADTNKINFNIDMQSEDNVEELAKTTDDKDVTSVTYGRKTAVYDARNINFGLVERPENNIILDKEVSDIKLVTNDGNTIFDAVYDINYRLTERLDDSMIVIGKVPPQQKDSSGEIVQQYLIAEAVLNTEKSVGIEQLQALNKNERKLIGNDEGKNVGQQNFRFINVDTDILQGTTIQVEYLLTAINLSELDYTSETLDGIANVAVANQTTAKQEIRNLANEVREAEIKGEILNSAGGYDRRYLGNFYDSGNPKQKGKVDDVIVTTKIRQLVDYADNDSIFVSSDNMDNNHLWRNTTITELAGSGIEANRILNANVIPTFQKLDKYGVEYIVKQDDKTSGKLVQRNNLLLSIDDDTVAEEGTVKSNAGFERKLVPLTSVNGNVNSTAYKADIKLTISKTVAAQDDADNLAYDNLSEIVKLENTVGRRDVTILVGNADPVLGEFDPASMEERDASATELITFTPPTGLGVKDNLSRRVALILSTTTAFVLVVIVIANRKNIFKKKIYK